MHEGGSHRNTGAGYVIPFYVAGSVALIVIAVLCILSVDSFFGHYFQPRLLAITHITALGWGTMVIFGASFQFLPVLLETQLFSEKLAKITFCLMVIGVPLLGYSFWEFDMGPVLQFSALCIIVSIVFFGVNIYRTAKRAKEWSIAADFIVTSVGWLLLTAVAGTLLAFNFTYLFLPESHLIYLKVHAHLGIVGWFLLLVIGVSSRLIPMFLVSPKPGDKYLSFCYYFISTGLVLFIANTLIFLNDILNLVSVFGILAGLLSYFLYARQCYLKRARKVLDTGMKQSLVAFVLLFLPLVLIISTTMIGSGEKQLLPFCIAYGFSIFFGFISTLILGQTYKTLPFIAWLKLSKEKRTSGRLPKDLYSDNIARSQFGFHICGFLILLPAILFKLKMAFLTGAVCLLISAVLFNLNVFKILLHLIPKSNEPVNR